MPKHARDSSSSLPVAGSIQQPGTQTILSLTPIIQELLLAASPEQRSAMQRVWSALRPVIRNLEIEKEATLEENRQLRLERAQQDLPPFRPSSPALAARPDTASSVARGVEELEDLLDEFRRSREDDDATTIRKNKLWDMPTETALQYLLDRRDNDTEQQFQEQFGKECWMKLPDADRYPKLNLKNTLHHSGVGKYGCNLYMHHVAVVAAGRGENLLSVVQKPQDGVQYHVSHICHNERCFRPDHVYVEAASVNEARKTCEGRCHVDCRGCGAVYDACPHARYSGSCGKDCILPRFDGKGGTFHRAVRGGYFVASKKD